MQFLYITYSKWHKWKIHLVGKLVNLLFISFRVWFFLSNANWRYNMMINEQKVISIVLAIKEYFTNKLISFYFYTAEDISKYAFKNITQKFIFIFNIICRLWSSSKPYPNFIVYFWLVCMPLKILFYFSPGSVITFANTIKLNLIQNGILFGTLNLHQKSWKHQGTPIKNCDLVSCCT